MNLTKRFKKLFKKNNDVEQLPIVWHRGIKKKYKTSFVFEVKENESTQDAYNNLIHKKARVLNYFIENNIISVEVKYLSENKTENIFVAEVISNLSD